MAQFQAADRACAQPGERLSIGGPDEVPARFGEVMAKLAGRELTEIAEMDEITDPGQQMLQRLLASSLPPAAMSESPFYLPLMFAGVSHVLDQGLT
ncbi:MAG: hypothetical protein GY898_31660, partial [Proteobacteria bacterium]|nr:hypothetical protein [Pseudomonadota bacterium]